jgi:hypothetical protein
MTGERQRHQPYRRTRLAEGDWPNRKLIKYEVAEVQEDVGRPDGQREDLTSSCAG